MVFPRDRSLNRGLPVISAEERAWLLRSIVADTEPEVGDRRVSSLVIAGSVRRHRVLTRLDFVDARLEDTGWERVRFHSVHWVDAALVDSRFSSSVFEECAWFDVHLTRVVFEACEFRDCMFGSCWSQGVTFRDCTFSGCEFVLWSDVAGALEGCRLDDCTIDQLSVSRSRWSGVQCHGSKVARCTFSAADSESVIFEGCRVQGMRWLGGVHRGMEIRGGEGTELVWYRSSLDSLLIADRAQLVDVRLAGSTVGRLAVREAEIQSLSLRQAEQVVVDRAELSAWSWIGERAHGRVSVENSSLTHTHVEKLEFDELVWSSVLLQGSIAVLECGFTRLDLKDVRHAGSLEIQHRGNSYPPGSPTLDQPHGP